MCRALFLLLSVYRKTSETRRRWRRRVYRSVHWPREAAGCERCRLPWREVDADCRIPGTPHKPRAAATGARASADLLGKTLVPSAGTYSGTGLRFGSLGLQDLHQIPGCSWRTRDSWGYVQQGPPPGFYLGIASAWTGQDSFLDHLRPNSQPRAHARHHTCYGPNKSDLSTSTSPATAWWKRELTWPIPNNYIPFQPHHHGPMVINLLLVGWRNFRYSQLSFTVASHNYSLQWN